MLELIIKMPELYPADAKERYLARVNEAVAKAGDDWQDKGLSYMLKYHDAQIKENHVELFIPSDMAPELDSYVKVECPGCESTELGSCVVCQRPKVAVRRQRNLPPKVKIDARVIEPTWSDDEI